MRISILNGILKINFSTFCIALKGPTCSAIIIRACKYLPTNSPSGYYWIQPNSSCPPVQVYCDTSPKNCSCSTTEAWMRVANLDMTDPAQDCPDGFRLVRRTEPPLRTCGRPGPVGCVSTTFPTHGIEYSRVCGRVIGYQDKSPDAFFAYTNKIAQSIDDFYVGGVSLTHGRSPRQHIWTFAAALDEAESESERNSCPCINSHRAFRSQIPPFIGQDYFCDTANLRGIQHRFFPNDPLWDGQGCGSNSTCCEFNSPPWFCKQLSQPTTDDIELRLCDDQLVSDEDTPIERVEIYIN